MKPTLPTLLTYLAIGCAAFGQTANAPIQRVETQTIVAEVNGDRISQNSLAAECLLLHGESELGELINKTLIRQECERQNLTITADEINDEILRMARTFGLDSEQWLRVLEQRRGISPEQFRQDTIWQILALEKIAGPRLNPTDTELAEAYEAEFGVAVQTRWIVLGTKADAEAIHAELKQHPETFARVAQNKSIDASTKPFGGMLSPIRRHTMRADIENMLFSLQPGQVSPITEDAPFPGQFSIYLCEGFLQPFAVDDAIVESRRRQLFFHLRGEKRQQIAGEIFKELRDKAQVKVIFGNPELYSQYPGVAAFLNGRAINMQELADICVAKHGKDALNDMISRLLVEQACRPENIRISEQDIDNEIREMAFKHLPILPNGEPNVELWLRRALDETRLSFPMYRKNVVVPMLSLKRLTLKYVQVTEDDILRSYEANFGQKVRCLAIFFRAQDHRRATEVWNKANAHRTETNFGDLAAEYSFDPESRLGRGVIPAIARHSGHPVLEKAAFALKPAELSQIIQVDDHLVILFCVGYTDALAVKIDEVRVDLIADIFEKKQQLIISRYFERLYAQAAWHNFLTGESQNPTLQNATPEGTTTQR